MFCDYSWRNIISQGRAEEMYWWTWKEQRFLCTAQGQPYRSPKTVSLFRWRYTWRFGHEGMWSESWWGQNTKGKFLARWLLIPLKSSPSSSTRILARMTDFFFNGRLVHFSFHLPLLSYALFWVVLCRINVCKYMRAWIILVWCMYDFGLYRGVDENVGGYISVLNQIEHWEYAVLLITWMYICRKCAQNYVIFSSYSQTISPPTFKISLASWTKNMSFPPK